MLDFNVLKNSFKYAYKGFWYVFKHEQNFRLELLVSVIVLTLMAYFQVSKKEVVVLIMIIVAVLALEMINTVIEKLVDMLKPRIHFYAEIIKNIMAAVVMLASAGAIIVGAIIFWPYVYRLWFGE